MDLITITEFSGLGANDGDVLVAIAVRRGDDNLSSDGVWRLDEWLVILDEPGTTKWLAEQAREIATC